MPGRFYEQWTIGDRILHQPHRTVTETDNLLISALTHNPQPLHLDAEYAAATEFGRVVVNGLFTFSLMIGSRSPTQRCERSSPTLATTPLSCRNPSLSATRCEARLLSSKPGSAAP